MLRSIAIAGLLAMGCKADKPAEPAASTESTETKQPAQPLPNGKADLGMKRPNEQPALGANSRGHQMIAERRRERMAKVDTDGDGVISEDERKAMRAKRAEDMRKRLDLDGDGKVTTAEISKSTFARMDPEKLDANKDGNITLEEIEAAMAERAKAWGAGRRDRTKDPTAPKPAPTPAPAPAPNSTPAP